MVFHLVSEQTISWKILLLTKLAAQSGKSPAAWWNKRYTAISAHHIQSEKWKLAFAHLAANWDHLTQMIFLLLSSFAQEACKQPFPLLISWAALLPAKSIQDSGRPQICERYSSSLSTTTFSFPRERKCNTCWLLTSLTWRSKTTLRNSCAGAALHVTTARRFLTQFQQEFLRIFTALNKQKCTVLLSKRSGRTAV